MGIWKHGSILLERFAILLALCCVAWGVVRIVSTYRQLSITKDEPYHFHLGLQYLTTHARDRTEQPPLAQAAAALLPFWDGARAEKGADDEPFTRQLLLGSPDPWRVIARMRAGVLPFFVLACLAVFWGACIGFGRTAAVCATALFTLIPPVLAHAGLATTDMALTASMPAAFFLLVWWCKAPGWRRALPLGSAAGIMVLSKFSGLVFLPAAGAFAIAFSFAGHKPARRELEQMVRDRAPSFALAMGIAALVVWAGFFFSIGPVPSWHSGLRVPAPELFEGIHQVAEHNRAGHSSYLLGEHRMTGWWYFFPVVLSVKTPIPLLMLAVCGLFAGWRLRDRGGLLPIALCLGVLAPAMASRINLGSRHVLPFYAGLAILGGLGILQLVRWLRGAGAVAALALIVWMALSGARSQPDFLGYCNEFAGDQPESILLDSDLDWDQDLVLLAHSLHQLGVSKVWFDYLYPDFATRDVLEKIYGFPEIQPRSDVPQPGWHAESLNELYLVAGGLRFRPDDPKLSGNLAPLNGPWYQRLRPVERVGGDVLYHIPDDFAP